MRHPRHPSSSRPAAHGQPGFTMVELMISIAISLLLVAGINAIFRTTAQVVGIGMSQSLASRDIRATQTIMESDFGNLRATPVANMPAFIIQSMNQVAFRDLADERLDAQFNAGAYLAPGGINNAQRFALMVDSGAGTYVSPQRKRLGNPLFPLDGPSIILDNRNHRVDILSFFARGFFRRQTADPRQQTYQSGQSANEAYVWYGHLRQPNSTTNADWTTPTKYMPLGMAWDGASAMIPLANNSEQHYASKWKLGRRLMLLVNPDSTGSIIDPANFSQLHHYVPPPPVNQLNLTPLAFGTPTRFNSAGAPPAGAVSVVPPPTSTSNQFPVQDSRLDLAGTTLRDYQTKVANFQSANKERWYIPLVAGKNTATYPNPILPATLTNAFLGAFRPDDAFRFACKPWISKSSNLTSMTFDEAMTAPMFVSGCSQFCVEFAGDYFTQNDVGTLPAFRSSPNPPFLANDFGVVTDAASDGVIDFDVVYAQKKPGEYLPLKKIRWYGMTRSTDGSPDQVPTPRLLPDPHVIHPVNWHLATMAGALVPPAPAITHLPFEKIGADSFPRASLARLDSYTCAWGPQDLAWDPSGTDVNYAGDATHRPLGAPDATHPNGRYPASFMPWMVRITMRIDDPNGRLQDGQTVEWIFNLPHVAP